MISVCACVRERARGCVGGFLNISIGVVRLKQLKLLSFKEVRCQQLADLNFLFISC